ncbi:putative 1,2-dihydroxy-3-keto-5-methylthiopentene dioxygenase [Halotydeus destructor]|nr:putative 1,2-dihydroxy-3-keto-5-methylthiopentene dioxygenase [Halotydeus destructor]
MVRCWYVEDETKQVSLEKLRELSGAEVVTLDVSNYKDIGDRFVRERNYAWYDVIENSPETIKKFDEKTEIFRTEHFHAKEEVRCVLSGKGYFDVRDINDDWIRIEVVTGDLLILPASIFHRFSFPEGEKTIGLLNIYLLHPYNVVVRIETDKELSLPGITLCSDIGVKLSSLEKMPGFNESLEKAKADYAKKQQVLDMFSLKFRTAKPVETLLNMSIQFSEFLNTSYTKCAGDCNLCSTYKGYISTYQKASEKCFTVFHVTNRDKEKQCTAGFGYAATPEQMSKATAVGDTEPSEIGLQPKEIIRFQIMFDKNDTVNIDEPPYATILVHHNDMIPTMQRYRTARLKPGFYYEISIQAQKTKVLASPFDTKCEYYHLKERKNFKLHPILDTPRSQQDCMIQCLGSKTISTCQCWPPELPYASMLETKPETEPNTV